MYGRMVVSLVCIPVITGLILGCSGGKENPVVPLSNATAAFSQTNRMAQTHLWGIYDVSIDTATGVVTVVPNRQAMFTANVVNILNGNSAGLSFKINGIISKPDYTDIDIDVTLKHPFPGLHQYDGYDVRGVFMGDGSGSLVTGHVTYPMPGVDQLMLPDPVDGFGGPDGYTRWYNYTEFSGTGMPLFQYTQGKLATPGFKGISEVNPYKYFADSLGATENLWSWLDAHATQHGVFSAGMSNARNYYLRFPTAKSIKYGYAILANWQGVEPKDHPSNAPEAVGCSVVDKSDVFYVDAGSKGGNLKLDISPWNWGAGITSGVMDEFTIIVESTVLSAPYTASSANMTPVGGNANYSTYQFDIPANNVNGVNGNEYWVLVQQNKETYANEFGIPNQAGNDPLTGYFRYDLSVSDHQTQCPIPHPTAITGSPHGNNGPVTCTITCDNLVGATGLAAYLDLSGTIDGTYDIAGTGITNVNLAPGTFDVTFDLTGVEIGDYYVIVTNSCGETGASDTPLFTVTEYLVGDIYVSNHPDFDGLPEEGTMEHPFHTIQAGINAGKQDNLILVDYGTGTYAEAVYLYGTDLNLTVRAYNWHSPSGRPALDGPPVDADQPSLRMYFVHHMTWQGFKFHFGGADPGWSSMVDCDWCDNLIFKDCYFTGDVPDMTHTLVEAIQMYWTTDCKIENCLFKNINAGNIIGAWPFDTVQTYAIGGGWNVNLEVTRCEFTDIQNQVPSGSWMRVVGVHLDFDWGAMNVHNNLIHHLLTNSSSSTTMLFVYGIQNNEPLEYAAPGNGTGTIDHNTIDGITITGFPDSNSYGGIGIYSYNYDTSTFVADVDVQSDLITNLIGSTNQRMFGISDNRKGDYCDIWNVKDGGTLNPWVDPSDEGINNIYVDPMYVNSSTAPYDYHLKSGSPCKTAGKDGTEIGCYGNLGAGQKIGLLGPED